MLRAGAHLGTPEGLRAPLASGAREKSPRRAKLGVSRRWPGPALATLQTPLETKALRRDRPRGVPGSPGSARVSLSISHSPSRSRTCVRRACSTGPGWTLPRKPSGLFQQRRVPVMSQQRNGPPSRGTPPPAPGALAPALCSSVPWGQTAAGASLPPHTHPGPVSTGFSGDSHVTQCCPWPLSPPKGRAKKLR